VLDFEAMHAVHARKRVRRALLSSIILLSLFVVSAPPVPSHVSFCAKSSQSLARSTSSPRAARESPAMTPLAERRRPRLAGLLRLDVYVVPPLRCISYISPSRTQRGRLVPNLTNQLRDASLHSDAQFTLRGIYRDAWPHHPGTESPRMHVCSSSLMHVQVRAAFPLPFRRARADDLVLQR
jgi:hypothetical protein